jgi:hypothetical protein
LAKAEWLKELSLGMAESRLYDIRRRDWQTRTSAWRTARWTERNARTLRDQLTSSWKAHTVLRKNLSPLSVPDERI